MGDGVPTDQLSHNHCDCYHKMTTAGTFHNVYKVDGIKGDAEHEVPEPEGCARGGLVSSVKTRSVQDTFHDAFFCLTPHHKTSTPPPTRVFSTMLPTQRLLQWSSGARTCCLLCSTSASDWVQCPVRNRSRSHAQWNPEEEKKRDPMSMMWWALFFTVRLSLFFQND